jgi:alpha-galactosidase
MSATVAAALSVAVVAAVQVVSAAAPAQAVANGLALTPPMGFNDWNSFGCSVDEQLIKQTADFFVSSGLKNAGYTYVNIDDCWLNRTRSTDGHLVPDPVKFPDGITGTAAYVHSLGLKLGIYEDAGTMTCAGYPGSLGHEQTDANDFAAWGVDYLKYDNCNNQSDGSLADYQARYTAMGAALKNTGRPIVYSLCEWGVNDPASWAGGVGNLWRTTGDISDQWSSLKSIIQQNAPLYKAAGPGAWNDPDMLEVGNGGMTDAEYKTHFTLWSMMASPLLIGTDLRKASAATMAIYTNKDVIAVDQDRLGKQAVPVSSTDGHWVFAKPLSNGDVAVALYNETDTAATFATTASAAGLAKAKDYQLRDLWSKTTTESAGTIRANVAPHATVVYRVSQARKHSTSEPATTVQLTSNATYVTPGQNVPFTSTFYNDSPTAVHDVKLTAKAPAGWTMRATGSAFARQVSNGRPLNTSWVVGVPAGTTPGAYDVSVTATYKWQDAEHTGTATRTGTSTMTVVLPPPTGTSFVSDLPWLSSSNGWGPAERNTSNGENAAGDGTTITINGVTYAKGIGAHAPGEIDVFLGTTCTSFTSDVGVDDEKTALGTVVFQVWADGTLVADSGLMTTADPAKTITASMAGAQVLRLVVTDAGDGNNSDHADWAGAQITCT